MIKFWTGWILGVLCGMLLFIITLATSQPYCPTEDSCQPSYEHGKWTIVRVVP